MQKTDAETLLEKMRAAAGTGGKLARILHGDHIQNPDVAFRSLHQRAKRGNVVRHLETKVRAFCAVHSIDVPDDVFLTERQRRERREAAA